MNPIPKVKQESNAHPMNDKSRKNSLPLFPLISRLLSLIASMVLKLGLSIKTRKANLYLYAATIPGIINSNVHRIMNIVVTTYSRNAFMKKSNP
jgi:hypothetical protein